MLSQQQRQPVLGLFQRTSQTGDSGAGIFHCQFGLIDIQLRGQSGLVPPAGNVVGFTLCGQVVFGNFKAGLVAAHIDIVKRHFRAQTDQNVAQIFLRRLHGRLGRFDGAPLFAENIDFPTGIQAITVQLAGGAATGSLAAAALAGRCC